MVTEKEMLKISKDLIINQFEGALLKGNVITDSEVTEPEKLKGVFLEHDSVSIGVEDNSGNFYEVFRQSHYDANLMCQVGDKLLTTREEDHEQVIMKCLIKQIASATELDDWKWLKTKYNRFQVRDIIEI